jgi:type IV secretory pathway ATPase VirB11/archaellum biosynthesis ATPase
VLPTFGSDSDPDADPDPFEFARGLPDHLLDALRGGGGSEGESTGCRCETAFHEPTGTGLDRRVELRVDAEGCPGGGDLVASPDCRATVIRALAGRDADTVRSRRMGRERRYVDGAAGFLLAAGRFVERATWHDQPLASRAARDPLAAAREATGRAGPVADIAAETGLAAGAARVESGTDGVGCGTRRTETGRTDRYDTLLRPFVGPTVARSRVADPPVGGRLLDRRALDSGTVVRRYAVDDGPQRYCLDPVAHRLDETATAVLAAARDLIASGAVAGGDRAPHRAVRLALDDAAGTGAGAGAGADPEADAADVPVERLGRVLARYTRGNGVLDALVEDPRVSDVFVTSPAAANPVRATVDGEAVRTNVRLTPTGAATLASRFRRASGRSFSRAAPTLDAAVEVGDGGRGDRSGDGPERGGGGNDGRGAGPSLIRVAGVTEPASDGLAFAFRRHGDDAFTLPRLVANGTLPADAAALLSLAVERAAATLVAGTRGAGKTTLLGALLWELPETTRTVTVEDTPELPVDALQRHGRDVQALHAEVGDDAAFTPTDAVRTALRLGEGALVVGEVRGEEAAALYEAMRVGAGGSAVLGTIHGDGGGDVRERVVADLGVSESAFGATDLVVTCRRDRAGSHRVARIEELRTGADGVRFVPLFAFDDESDDGSAGDGGPGGGDTDCAGTTGPALAPCGPVERGNSRLIAELTTPSESYADVLAVLDRREDALATLATTGRTRPADLDGTAGVAGGVDAADASGGRRRRRPRTTDPDGEET